MVKKRVIYLAISMLFLSCAFIAVSCAPRTHREQTAKYDKSVVILDVRISKALNFVNSVWKRLPDGQILVQANFLNRLLKEDVWVEVKVEFYDDYDMVVDSTEWINTLFPAGEVTMVQGSSIRTNAVKHRLMLRNLRTESGKLPKK